MLRRHIEEWLRAGASSRCFFSGSCSMSVRYPAIILRELEGETADPWHEANPLAFRPPVGGC